MKLFFLIAKPHHLQFRFMMFSDDMPVKIRASGIHITIPARLLYFIWRDRGCHEAIIKRAALGKHISEGINNHGAAIFKLVIVHSDRV